MGGEDGRSTQGAIQQRAHVLAELIRRKVHYPSTRFPNLFPFFNLFPPPQHICGEQITCKINRSSPTSREICSSIFFSSFRSVDRPFWLKWTRHSSFPVKKMGCLAEFGQHGKQEEQPISHNPLLWDKVSPHRPAETPKGWGVRRRRRRLLDIYFSSPFLSFRLPPRFLQTTKPVRQPQCCAEGWIQGQGLRGRRERRGAVKRLPWLMLAENILIAKLNQPASRCGSENLQRRVEPRRYVAVWIFKPRCGLSLCLCKEPLCPW